MISVRIIVHILMSFHYKQIYDQKNSIKKLTNEKKITKCDLKRRLKKTYLRGDGGKITLKNL